MSTMDKLLELGVKLGLEGTELKDFVLEREKIEREERAAQREAQKAGKLAEAEAQKAEAEAQKEAEKEKSRSGENKITGTTKKERPRI